MAFADNGGRRAERIVKVWGGDHFVSIQVSSIELQIGRFRRARPGEVMEPGKSSYWYSSFGEDDLQVAPLPAGVAVALL